MPSGSPGPEPRASAAIYARISLDREGAGLGVTRQVEDCEALIHERGWQVHGVYDDNDISAYSGKVRPGYRRLLQDMQAGRVRFVVAWHTDRLHRSPKELEEWIEVCERLHITTVTVRAGELDLTTAAGRMVARMLGAAARHESEQKSERVKRARKQEAGAGKQHGPLGFGYNRDGSINQDQATIVREIARRVLNGESLYGIATTLNRRSVPTPSSAAWHGDDTGPVTRWRPPNLRQMILRGTLCGYREWEPGGRGHGRGELVAQGQWEAILTRQETERLRALLNDPGRKTSGRQPKYLLTGVLHCGRCQAPMSGSTEKRSGARRYACVAQPGLSRCGRCAVTSDPVDAMVTEAVLTALGDARLRTRGKRLSRQEAAASDELEQAQRIRDTLMIQLASGQITSREWDVGRSVLEARIRKAQGALGVNVAATALAGLPLQRHDLDSWWTSATLDQQRTVIRTLVEKVVVSPAGKGGNRFDPARIAPPVWRA